MVTEGGFTTLAVPGFDGVPRWRGPWTIYGSSRQTIAFTTNPRSSIAHITVSTGGVSPAAQIAVNGAPTANQTLTIGEFGWTFKANRTQAFEIGIDSSAFIQMLNIQGAINNDSYAPYGGGTSYYVFVTNNDGNHTLTVESIRGDIGTIAFSTTSGALSLTPFSGGVNSSIQNGATLTVGPQVYAFKSAVATARDILILRVDSEQRQAIIDTVNEYSTVVSAASEGGVKLTANTPGEAGNSIALATTAAGLSLVQFSGGSDGGACSYIFASQETAPIAFNAAAADYQAAFAALSAVGVGHVTASGIPGAIDLVFEDSIIPTSIATGTNNLTNGGAPAVVLVYITNQRRSVEIYTPQVGDLVLDIFTEVIESFIAGAAYYVDNSDAAAANGPWYTSGVPLTAAPDMGDDFSSSSGTPRSMFQQLTIEGGRAQGMFPARCLISTPIYISLEGIGGPGNTTGIVKVYVTVAAPVAPEN